VVLKAARPTDDINVMWRIWSFALALVAALTLVPAQDARAAGGAEATLVARVVMPASARAAPRLDARRVMRLTGVAEWSRGAQWLMVTGRLRDRAGRDWVRVQLPIRPNGTAGWVPGRSLRLTGTRVRFEVHLGSRRLEIWLGSRRVASWSAGIGRAETPTPVGRFAIQDAVVTPDAWRGIYGDFTVALTAHSPTLRTFMGGQALIGIHGTGGDAARIGRPSSNGCVILGASELARAAHYAKPGTPVIIDRS
jgi:lipoprotein-anchoring transpeptidase ErfK/SrfK